MIEEIDLFRLAGSRMNYLADRQTVLAKNIANADTPNYRAQDLAPFSFASALLKGGSSLAPQAGSAPPLTMVRTSAAHLGDAGAATHSRIETDGATYGEKPDGNTVSLEQQMVKSSDVANAYALATTAYAKSLSLIKIGVDAGK